MLTTLRTYFTPAAKERWYLIVLAVSALLVPWGLTSGAVAQQVAALALAGVTLLFAAVNAETTWRTALYGVLAPLQALAQLFGIFTDQQWLAIAGLVAAVLGLGTAAAKTPTTPAPTAGKHSAVIGYPGYGL